MTLFKKRLEIQQQVLRQNEILPLLHGIIVILLLVLVKMR